MLNQGANPNARDAESHSLRGAIRDILDRLLFRHPSQSETPSALMLVFDPDRSMPGNPEPLLLVQALVARGADVNAVCGESGWYASPVILHASAAGYAGCVEILIRGGADVNARNAAGMTPIMLAANLATMKTLLRNGADVNARTVDGVSVLAMAANYPDDRSGRPALLKGAGAK